MYEPTSSDRPLLPGDRPESLPVDGDSGLRAGLLRAIPILFVLSGLGVAGTWGYATDWTFRFRNVAPAVESIDDGAPENLPAVTAFGWCDLHGIHECPLCHPEVAQVGKAASLPLSAREQVLHALRMRAREENDRSATWTLRRLQFASAEATERYNLDVAPVWATSVTEVVSGSGEIDYDPQRVVRLSPRAAGTVWRVYHKVGDHVRRGDPLALVEAGDVGKAKAEFLQALVQLRARSKAVASLKAAGDVMATQLREAEAAVRDSEIRLLAAEQSLAGLGLALSSADYRSLDPEAAAQKIQFAGLPQGLRNELDLRTTSSTLLPIIAPQDGELLSSDVVAGEVVDAYKTLFVVGDVSRLRLTLHVAQDEARLVAAGQPLRFRPDGSGRDVTAAVSWVSPSVDDRTRTVAVRAELLNSKPALRAHTLGVGQIVIREQADALTVPLEAVVNAGGVQLVFVRDKGYLKADGPKAFHARQVRVGARQGPDVEIIAGLLPGEVVVTRGSSLLGKELQKKR